MQGYYIENTGPTDVVLLAVFKTAEYAQISRTATQAPFLRNVV